jgi:hypothetical protein
LAEKRKQQENRTKTYFKKKEFEEKLHLIGQIHMKLDKLRKKKKLNTFEIYVKCKHKAELAYQIFISRNSRT